MHVRTEYIAASVNRFPQAADASSSSLVAFGSGRFVAFWNTTDRADRGVYDTLPGHEASVTCVRFARDDLLISGDEKGFVGISRQTVEHWDLVSKFRAHTQGISAIAFHGDYLITGASDSSVKIWRANLHTGAAEELQRLDPRGNLPLTLALTSLPGVTNGVILAVGGTGTTIQVWSSSSTNNATTLAGHEDWIRSLTFRPPTSQQEPIILASGSGDSTIRLWNIEPQEETRSSRGADDGLSDELLDAFEASLGNPIGGEEGGRQISLKRHSVNIRTPDGRLLHYYITFDALLIGHEAAVTSLSWQPPTYDRSPPTLLSSSTDSSVILWSPSSMLAYGDTQSIWINRQRFGDVGGQRLGGFVGGLWAKNGSEVLAWGWSGGWRRWQNSSTASGHKNELWREIGAVTGHGGPVHGIDWSPGGEYLLSSSFDQTTRIHGPVRTLEAEDSSAVWHEIGRPQVHGYDLLRVQFINALRFISIADEKVARVFDAPQNFVELLGKLRISVASGEQVHRDDTCRLDDAAPPHAGITWRPTEGELASMTLWPEVEKIFGHGYESISLAVSSSKKLFATACKATAPEHAVVRVYDAITWTPFGTPLTGHTLTVTRIAFSPDDRFILTASRDRSWRLFERKGEEGYVPAAAGDKAHARIIWDCAWSKDGDVFATASRDKTAMIWRRVKEDFADKWAPIVTIKAKEALTAVALSPKDESGRRWMALGQETGEILIYSCRTQEKWALETTLDHRSAHLDHVHQLQWRPVHQGQRKELASCSEDGTLKVHAMNE
ncbi:WD40 repeat-like protein [Punctularia strigosozonata HHB-11173 SS5]|uniref:WD40 repeat-like protein n=1 Tax=Punctularia strigosozonata (strain HHB-11173) TaxID=741275 RepID=UPI0004417B72|nr:WD40 repeat-like protein [Punctularia strigosozonata HHB-11173 SS5]EIN10688.1 WD40 repeat-like protein [Punctularia strigosozonata HHB-11173 SS5]